MSLRNASDTQRIGDDGLLYTRSALPAYVCVCVVRGPRGRSVCVLGGRSIADVGDSHRFSLSLARVADVRAVGFYVVILRRRRVEVLVNRRRRSRRKLTDHFRSDGVT